MQYRADIDGLRSVAVLLVLIYHFDLVPGISAGFTGVDVFFVISGFLITRVIADHLKAGTFRLGDFYLRRIRRLAPSLFAVNIAAFAVGAFVLFPADFEALAKQTIATQAYVSNIYFWQTINYFGLSADQVPMLHTWSLAVEEQFYLLFPLFMMVVARVAGHTRLAIAIAGAALASFVLNLLLVHAKPEAVFYLLPTRAWELLIGGALALVSHRVVLSRWGAEVVAGLGLIGILLGAVVLDKNSVFPGWAALLPCLGGAAIIAAGTTRGALVNRLLGTRLPVYVGKISYSLYLVHWPIAVYARALAEGPVAWPIRWACFALSVVLAALLYHFIENRWRRPQGAERPGRTLAVYGGTLAAVVIASVVVIQTKGWPGRFNPQQLAFAKAASDRHLAPRACDGRHDFDPPPCRFGRADGDTRAVVWGDSHALASYSAFAEYFDLANIDGRFTFKHACPPLLGVTLRKDGGTCARYNQSVLERISQDHSIETVYLVSLWRQIREGAAVSPDGSPAPAFSTAFEETLSALNDAGKRVVVMGPVPTYPFDVPTWLARHTKGNDIPSTKLTLDLHHEGTAYFWSTVDRHRHLIDSVVDPARGLCTPECRVVVGETVLYADSNHISRSGNRFLTEILVEQLGVQ